MYAQWYDTSYKAGPTANTVIQVSAIQLSSKPKNKYYKRKNEFIDPAQDAGDWFIFSIIIIIKQFLWKV